MRKYSYLFVVVLFLFNLHISYVQSIQSNGDVVFNYDTTHAKQAIYYAT